ncbi:MAG: PepSY-like domain-containing protein [Bacteroidetes bacterium]|nr:PepSY-like domain-containing protein [Bacteroidota bacterium]
MKTLSVVFLFLLCAVAVRAQDVPAAVETAFNQRFAKAESIVWDELEEGEYTATFILKGIEMSARFDAAGQWMSSTFYLEDTDVPSAVQKAVAKQFPEYDMYDVVRIENPDGKYYEMTLESEEDALVVQVGETGKILKKEPIAIDMD